MLKRELSQQTLQSQMLYKLNKRTSHSLIINNSYIII